MKTNLEQFICGYITCALWATMDENDKPLDANYKSWNIAPQSKAKIEKDCADFVAKFTPEQWAEYSENREVNSGDGSVMEHAGHDFFLTRCGHDAGFWDRGLPEELSDAFCAVCDEMGEVWPYAGDDGQIYF